MHGAMIMAIIFSGIVMALAVLGGTILMAIKLFKGSRSNPDPHTAEEEARMIQEIYRNLTIMEERVEALEVILHDIKKKG